MSWLYSQALVAEYSAVTCSDGALSALSSGVPTPQAFWSGDKMKATSRPSRYGMTSEPLTDVSGEALLTWFRGASRAKRSAPPREVPTRRKISGRKCGESWQMSLPGVSLPRTSRKGQLTTQPTTSKRWATKPAQFPFQRRTWVLTTNGPGFGYLHTPTATGNYCAPSMQKWPCARAFRQVFGAVTPEAHEYLMGWPIGWSASEPLETDRFQSWLQAHFSSLSEASKEAA